MRWLLLALTGLALFGSAATVAIAFAVSSFVAAIFSGKSPDTWWLTVFLAAVVFKVGQSWLQEFLAVRAAVSAKRQLRQQVISSAWEKTDLNSADLAILAGRALDALDSYFSKYLPQLVYALLVTPLMVVLFWITDLGSGITLVVTLPLIPLFMILIGWSTSELQKKQFESLRTLTRHFAEVVKHLSTLKLFGRSKIQVETISKVSDSLRIRTMKVLRLSFLSGFTLELVASLSVALVAVSVGMRLATGAIPFSTALFLLILAPEAFLPLRAVGANFHASSEGMAAASSVLDYIDTKPKRIERQSLDIRFGDGLTLITGPSGSGKSAIYFELLGFSQDKGTFSWLGETGELRRELVAWMPQNPNLGSGSIFENIVGMSVADSDLLFESVSFADLDELANASIASLSGGEAARVNLARAYYRLRQRGLGYLLLDEPTASLDAQTSLRIRERLKALSESGIKVVVISHENDFVDLANEVIQVA